MTMSAAQLGLVLPELGELVGGGLRKVLGRPRPGFVLELRAWGRSAWILVGLEEGAARVCRLEQKGGPAPASESPDPHEGAWAKPAPHGPTGFMMLLRKHLKGAQLLAASQVGEDRVLRLDWEAWAPRDDEDDADEPQDGERVRLVLWVELTPKAPLVVLTDEAGVILGSQGAGVCARPLTGGATYAPPPAPPASVLRHAQEDPLGLGGLPPDGGRSRAVAASFEALALRLEAKARGGEALRRLQRQLDALGKRVLAVEQDAKRAEEAQGQKRKGELLQGAYGRVAKGASSVEVQDYWEEGAPLVTVALDPKLDLQGNIDRCFKKYRKYKDAEGRILERLEECERRRDEARAALVELQAAVWEASGGAAGRLAEGEAREVVPWSRGEAALAQAQATRARLEALAKRLHKAGLLPAPQEAPKRREGEEARQPYREFLSRKGRKILVGRGGRDNDVLSLTVARGSDLWLHAQDQAGAHVVVRLGAKEELDHESLLDAATLAAWYSKARGEAVIDVRYTRAKHLRKPKGLPAGMVMVAGGKTLAVRLERDRVRRLLGPDAQF